MKKAIKVTVLILLFIGLTVTTLIASDKKVSTYAEEINANKTALIQERLDQTLDLLNGLAVDEYITSPDVTFLEKAQFLTDMNKSEELGYMMIRILDQEMNIYREGVGTTSNLASRDYMQATYSTGTNQVTDAFLAGADGTTVNYTVTAPIKEDNKEDGKVVAALMAAIYGDQLDQYLQDDDAINVLIGSKLQYMSGASEEQFGLAVAQVLESETTTSRPVENILLEFQEQKGGAFWGIGDGVQYFTYTPVDNCAWTVMTEVQALPLVKNILLAYAGLMLVLVIITVLLFHKKKKDSEPKPKAKLDEDIISDEELERILNSEDFEKYFESFKDL